MKQIIGLFAVAGLATVSFAVDSNSVEAFDNATVMVGGPRTGTNGKNFLNIEGKGLGNFASYGVVDFDASAIAFGGAISGITGIKIDFTQSNAAFTDSGNLKFWLTSDISTSIQPGSSLFFDSSSTYGVAAGQLGSLIELGTGAFTEVGNGTVDSYSFNVSGAVATLLTSTYNSDSTLRLVITQDLGADTVAATWAGFSNSTVAGPTVTLSAAPVPEPATMAALGVGVAALLRRRKKA